MQPDNGAEQPPTRNKAATADYIADLCRDLARMARGERFDTLAYLLDVATLEAENAVQQYVRPGSSVER